MVGIGVAKRTSGRVFIMEDLVICEVCVSVPLKKNHSWQPASFAVCATSSMKVSQHRALAVPCRALNTDLIAL